MDSKPTEMVNETAKFYYLVFLSVNEALTFK